MFHSLGIEGNFTGSVRRGPLAHQCPSNGSAFSIPLPAAPDAEFRHLNAQIAHRMNEHEDKAIYKVVVNQEEQYSIWPADRANAPGWRDAGKTGDKSECLAYIKSVWTDMRPLSLRKKMAEASAQDSAPDRPAT